MGAGDRRGGRLGAGPGVAHRSGCRAGRGTGAQVCHGRRDRSGSACAPSIAGVEDAARSRPLAEDAPLALSHGCRLPILQGPMTRVSDVAPFAEAVAREGGSLSSRWRCCAGPRCERLLERQPAWLAGRPWGVGLLGFAPADLREEQLAAVKAARPPFALIAGGRPDQAAELETGWDRHLPARPLTRPARSVPPCRSPAVRARGARMRRPRRPAVELCPLGAGCRVLRGGHRLAGVAAESLSVVFAGGIHDARSAALVAATGGRPGGAGSEDRHPDGHRLSLHARGRGHRCHRSALPGEALRCAETVLLETGPGHQVRVSPTPFVDRFDAERMRLLAEGRSHEEIREALERLNAGRLRVAAKGVESRRGRRFAAGRRAGAPSRQPTASTCSARSRPCAIGCSRSASLHQRVTTGADRLDRAVRPSHRTATPWPGRVRPPSRSWAWRPFSPVPRTSRRSGPTPSAGSTPSPRFPPTAGTGGSITTPTRRPPTRSTRSGAGSCRTFPSTRSATACPRPACRRSSPRSCWRSRSRGGPRRRRLRRAAVSPRTHGRRSGHGGRCGPACHGLCLPVVPADARHGHPRWRARRRWSVARDSCPNGPRIRFRASCST